MRRFAVNVLAVAMIGFGGAHLAAQEAPDDSDVACCTSGFGVTCCGTVCMAGLFKCEVIA